MIQQILLAITFVYGPLYLITRTKIFTTFLVGIIESISPFEKTFNLSKWLQIIFFYFSLCYQSWYWLFKTI